MNRWILACAVVALSAGIYLLLEMGTADLPSTAGARTPPVTPAPVAPLVVGRHEHPSLAVVTERGKPAPAEANVSEDRTPSEAPPTADEMRDRLEASFASDVSAAPSQDRTQGIEKRVRAVIPAGSSVRRLECRSSSCRIETMHPSLEEFRDFVQRGYLTRDFATRVSNGPVFVGLLAPPEAGQPVVGVAFLGRDGAVLPTFTPIASAGGPR